MMHIVSYPAGTVDFLTSTQLFFTLFPRLINSHWVQGLYILPIQHVPRRGNFCFSSWQEYVFDILISYNVFSDCYLKKNQSASSLNTRGKNSLGWIVLVYSGLPTGKRYTHAVTIKLSLHRQVRYRWNVVV